MNFSEEPHVRIYTTVSPTSRTWGFFGRMLMDALVKVSDSAGVIELPEELLEDLPTAVASVLACPDVEWVEKYLSKLMTGPRPSVELRQERFLVLPRYIEAQYAKVSPNCSARMSRKKSKDIAQAVESGLIDAPDQQKTG